MNLLSKACAVFLLIILCLPATSVFAGGTGAADYETQSIKIAMETEPPTLNSTQASDATSMGVLQHVMEGLLRRNKRDKLVPGVAEKWELTDQGITFWLRKDAKWSDGKPVTAHDFVFAWRTVVEPKTASIYAFIMFPIKNAEAINMGEKDVKEFGVSAVDDYTLQVEFERPCGYFPGLTAFATYFPLREDFYASRGERYAADAGDLLSNGPFKLTEWVHGASLKMEKNEHYWDRENITLNVIEAPYITADTRARLNLFKDGKIVLTDLDSETLKTAINERYKIRKFLDGRLSYLIFNMREDRLTRNLNLRKAFQAVFDPQIYVDKVIALPGNLPAYSLFPQFLPGVEKTFREEYPAEKPTIDVGMAKEYLEKAKQELGLEAIPPLVLLAGDNPAASKQAEYFQGLFKETLGIEIKIDKQVYKQRLAKGDAGEFDILASAWGPDYDDPMTFADLFASWNQNNSGKYSNSEYDKQIDIANNSMDQKARMGAMAACQKMIFEDVVILPGIEGGRAYVQSPQVKGIIRSVLGANSTYTHAKVVKPKK